MGGAVRSRRAVPALLATLAWTLAAGAQPPGVRVDLRAARLEGMPAGMAALILGGRPGGPVLSSVLALPLVLPAAGTADGRALVALLVEVDGGSLLGPEAVAAADLQVFAYAVDATGKVAAFFSQHLPLDLGEVGEAVFAGGVKLLGHLELAPGDYTLRVLVHEAASRRHSLRVLDLHVPAGPALLAPVVAEPPAPWLIAAEGVLPGGRALDFGALLGHAGVPLPSALPVLQGEQAELEVLVALAEGRPLPTRLEARFTGLDEQPAGTVTATVVAGQTTGLAGLQLLRVRVPFGALDTGSYYLTLEAPGYAASPELPVVLLRRGAAEALVWTDVQRRIRGDEPRVELAAGPPEGRTGRGDPALATAFAGSYSAVLGRLARGDRGPALEDLVRIEEALVEAVPEGALETLRVVEEQILERLAAEDPESLLPVALLHADAYRHQRERSAFGTATHGRTMAVWAAERYAVLVPGPEAAGRSSALLATLGADLQRAQVRTGGRQLLERAQALDRGNRYALLQLAAGYEKGGEYAPASASLERLVAIDPKSPEARVRLGVNLIRAGRRDEGTAVLDRLVREDNPEWVLTIAYQELARELLGRDRPAEAAELLRGALARLPAQGRLAVQLAYALDRAGRTEDAARALARLAPASAPSPRHLYSSWPEGDRPEMERRLDRDALLRLPRLAGSLEAVPGAEVGTAVAAAVRSADLPADLAARRVQPAAGADAATVAEERRAAADEWTARTAPADALPGTEAASTAAAAEAPPEEATAEGEATTAQDEEPPPPSLPADLRSRRLEGMPAGMAALILGGQPGGAVLTSVLALPLVLPPADAADGKAVVALLVEVDGASLLGPEPVAGAEIQLFAYAVDPGGRVAGFLAQHLVLDLAAVGEAVFTGGIKLLSHLELPPGEYDLRVLVNEASSKRYALRLVHLTVPSAPSLLAPLAAEPPAPWLVTTPVPQSGVRTLDFDALFQRAGVPLPSALPVFQGDEAALDVLVARRGATAFPEGLEVHLTDLLERQAGVLRAEILAREETGLAGLERLRVRVPFGDLATGSYYLSIAAPGYAASPELPAVVLRQGEDRAMLWTDVQRQIRGDEPRRAALTVEPGDRRRRDRDPQMARAFGRAYVTVLSTLARGDRGAALEDLARVEQELVASTPEGALETLRMVEEQVLARIAEVEPEALLPAALLHSDAYRHQRERSAFGTATHGRTMAVWAAEQYASRVAGREAAGRAAALLAGLGDDLQRAQVRTAGRQLLERARALDRDNRFAHLQLAAGFEKGGEYAPAVDALRRLVEIDPKSPEARVRLGVNLLRLGQRDEGAVVLDRLVREDNPEWVLAIAYQEMARELLRGDRPGEAADLLRGAVGRLPAQGRLAVQLAYALDRAGRSADAAAAVARMAPADGTSPRHRYNQWPEGDRPEMERRLAQDALLRLPRLAKALENSARWEIR